MDNLRRANAFAGSILKDINTAENDQELDYFMEMTLEEMIQALLCLPERVRALPYSVAIDLAMANDAESAAEALKDSSFSEMDLTDEEEAQMRKFLEAVTP